MIISSMGLYQFNEQDTTPTITSFIRSSTKAGDSNQSSIVAFLFTVLITGFYSKSVKINTVILSLSLIAIGMVATRSALISITLYFFIYMIHSMKGMTKRQRIAPILLIIIMISIVVVYNIFGDVILRSQELYSLGDMSSGRKDLINSAVNKSFNDSPIFGVGQGRVYPSTIEMSRMISSKSFEYSKYIGAPHNVWILTLCEYGIIGLIGLVLVFIFLLKQMHFFEPTTWAVISIFLVLMNAETILVHDQNLILICLVITSSIKQQNTQMI